MKNKCNMKLNELKVIRKQNKLSRKDLARLSGININTIQALETGINDAYNVKLSTLVALATALKVKIVDLLPTDIRNIVA